jgi:hypothetical protein
MRISIIPILIFLLIPGAAAAQPATNIVKVPPTILNALPREDVFVGLSRPLLMSVLRTQHTNELLGFINDLHLRPKVFDSDDADGGDVLLGLEFDYRKSIVNRVLSEASRNPMGISLAIEAKGDVAANARKNPNNLLEGTVGAHFFQGLGGIDPHYAPSPEAQLNLQRAIFASTTNKAAYAAAAREFTAHMRPQFFYDVQGHASLETDQQFHDKQWVYGGKVGVAFRDWRARSDVAWFNVLDYPFAALRWLVNKEDFQPSGRTFPSLVAGLDLVDPSDNDSRLAIDANADAYPRARVELGFKTPVMEWRNEPLYVSAGFRWFQEFGASGAIQAAGLDHSEFLAIKLDLPYKFNASYATGKLPLDGNNDQVYALGWSLDF